MQNKVASPVKIKLFWEDYPKYTYMVKVITADGTTVTEPAEDILVNMPDELSDAVQSIARHYGIDLDCGDVMIDGDYASWQAPETVETLDFPDAK